MPYKDKNKRIEYMKKYNKTYDRSKAKPKVYRTKEEIARYKHEYYIKHKEEIREYKNKWQKNWRKNNKNRLKENLRQVGRRKRKDYCEICNSKEKLEFHHWNYEKGIGSTLCKSCHKIQHQLNKNRRLNGF